MLLIVKILYRNVFIYYCVAIFVTEKCGIGFSAMNVPKGFLEEWWSLNYDFDSFRAWLQVQVGYTLLPLIVAQFKLFYRCNNVFKSHSSWI